MGMILKGLMDAGMDPEMPAAVLEKGTTAGQRRVVATVSTLKEESDRAGIGTPAMIVVGKVCTLADKLHWAEDRPLGGRQFPSDQAAAEYVCSGRSIEKTWRAGDRDAGDPNRTDPFE